MKTVICLLHGQQHYDPKKSNGMQTVLGGFRKIYIATIVQSLNRTFKYLLQMLPNRGALAIKLSVLLQSTGSTLTATRIKFNFGTSEQDSISYERSTEQFVPEGMF